MGKDIFLRQTDSRIKPLAGGQQTVNITDFLPRNAANRAERFLLRLRPVHLCRPVQNLHHLIPDLRQPDTGPRPVYRLSAHPLHGSAAGLLPEGPLLQ